MKKVIIISVAIATVLALVLTAICDLEVFLNTVLIAVLIGEIGLLIGGAWKGFVEIKNEIARRKELKRRQFEEN